MKVLLVNQTFYPDNVATSQYVLDLARYLVQSGHCVSVITSRRAYEDKSNLFQPYEKFEGIDVFRVGGTYFGKRFIIGRLCDSLTFFLSLCLQIWKIEKPDKAVSFTSPPLLGVVVCFLGKVRGIPVTQWLMDMNPDIAIRLKMIGGKVAAILRKLFVWSLRHSHSIVVLDDYMKQVVLNYGVPEEKIQIISPWALEMDSDVSPTFKIDGKFVVLYSGNHSVAHPLETLLQASLKLKEDPNILFFFVGGGVRVEEVSQFKERHQLENVIQLKRVSRENLVSLFDAANLHVMIMGEGMSGLLHLSKLYSVLLSGHPFVFIGPKESHVVDLLHSKIEGHHIESGEVARLVQVILETNHLEASRKQEIYQKNREVIFKEYTLSQVLGKSMEQLLA